MRFQNGCNKVVIELHVVQFLSEIILVISNRTRAAPSFDSEILTQRFRPNCTPLSSITIIYSFTYMKPIIVSIPFNDRRIGAPLLVQQDYHCVVSSSKNAFCSVCSTFSDAWIQLLPFPFTIYFCDHLK